MERLLFHERQHMQRQLLTNKKLEESFHNFIQRVSPQLRKWVFHSKNNVWLRNPMVETAIDNALSSLYGDVYNLISDEQVNAWSRSILKNDEFVRRYINGLQLTTTLKQGLFQRNAKALSEFSKRKVNGMDLSTRVWKLTEATKEQLGFYLESGLSSGSSAARISQDIRQLLNEPDRTFRRIRNEEGKLIQSAPMRNYHPGQGVYKSSYKNAMRLAVTEINMAYRTADYVRWNQLDFVTGVKVQRSGNGKPCRVCDQLVGVYPKEFKFVGFHSFCKCFAVPLMLNQDDFLNFILDDIKPTGQIIDTMPEGALKVIQGIKEGIEEKNIQAPYWFKDNVALFK